MKKDMNLGENSYMNYAKEENLPHYKEYYQENRYKICNRTLNVYTYKAMENIKSKIPHKVNDYFERYPWNASTEQYMRAVLFRKNISKSNGCYDDCCSAAMVAYMYSIHRCAFMGYDYVEHYTKKMICIYITCAINVYNFTHHLCRINGFNHINIDNEVWQDKI